MRRWKNPPLIDTSFVAHLLKLPYRHIWSDYDTEADVLYLSFRKPQGATDSIMESDGDIYHYRGKQLVGMTVLNASKRVGGSSTAGRKKLRR